MELVFERISFGVAGMVEGWDDWLLLVMVLKFVDWLVVWSSGNFVRLFEDKFELISERFSTTLGSFFTSFFLAKAAQLLITGAGLLLVLLLLLSELALLFCEGVIFGVTDGGANDKVDPELF